MKSFKFKQTIQKSMWVCQLGGDFSQTLCDKQGSYQKMDNGEGEGKGGGEHWEKKQRRKEKKRKEKKE